MEFVVTGADASTGKDVSIRVRAGDRAEAETLARAAGVFVGGIVPVRRGVGQLLFGTPARRRVTAACVMIALTLPLLAWWVNVKDNLFPSEGPSPVTVAADAALLKRMLTPLSFSLVSASVTTPVTRLAAANGASSTSST